MKMTRADQGYGVDLRRCAWRAVRPSLSLLFALVVMLVLGGCSSLPARGPLPVSQAFAQADVATTPLARVATASTPAGAQGLSGFRLLPTGEHAFDARAALADTAERSIDAQYYHLQDDAAGVAFLSSLHQAAQRGVRVRLLVDDFYAGDAFDLLLALNAERGVEVRLFNPLPWRSGAPLTRLLLSWPDFDRAQRRMHNKLFVVDNVAAVFGGRNIADAYFRWHGAANFVDLDLLAIGPVVPALSATFDAFWNSELAWRVDRVPRAGLGAAGGAGGRSLFDPLPAQVPRPTSAASLDPLKQTPVRDQLRTGVLPLHWGSATVNADPPTKITDPVALNRPTRAMSAKLAVIAQAREEVIIVNPYFVPDPQGMRMMADAIGKNVRGTVITNSLESTDEPLVHRAYSRYRKEILRMGMQLYEMKSLQPARGGDFGDFGASIGRLHIKGAAVDRRWLLVGSVNLDGRSAVLNTELAVNIDCPPLAAEALLLLGPEPWRAMYRVTLADDGQTLQWHRVDADGRVEVLVEEPGDVGWWRAWHRLQSLFVDEFML